MGGREQEPTAGSKWQPNKNLSMQTPPVRHGSGQTFVSNRHTPVYSRQMHASHPTWKRKMTGQTNRHAKQQDGQTDRQTDRQPNQHGCQPRQTDKQTTNTQTNKLTNRPTDKQTDKPPTEKQQKLPMCHHLAHVQEKQTTNQFVAVHI